MNVGNRLDLLNSCDYASRRAVLEELAAQTDFPAAGNNINMHLHSFFSFNAMGHSPTRLAWEARRSGLYAAGLCDFDVLDGLEEFLDAGRILVLRTAVNMETRAFLEEYADTEINSPGEPGITYIMGAGFVREPPADSSGGRALEQLRVRAARRNRDLVARINERLPSLSIGYTEDVLPLSPSDCPTERHIVRAYCRKAASLGKDEAIRLWSDVLGKSRQNVQSLLENPTTLEEAVRSRLVKRGGLAYIRPSRANFPPLDDFVKGVLAARAIPMATWLDGTSEGESNPASMLECLRAKGVVAVNIIPDRNWNIADDAERIRKIEKLRDYVSVASAMDLPINIGTEMNKDGQPFYDDLNHPALKEFHQKFLLGARVMIGQTVLGRYADYSYCDKRVASDFDNHPGKRNAFFAAAGRLPPLTIAGATALNKAGPAAALDVIRKSARRGEWLTG